MHVNRTFLNWGVFFILLGAVPLGVQQGVLDSDIVVRSWQLWPLLIVGAGLGLLLRRTAASWVGGVIVAATFGLMFGGLIAAGGNFASLANSCGSSTGQAFPAQGATLTGSSSVRLDFNCGDLSVAVGPGTAWTVNGTSDGGRVPRVDQGDGSLRLRTPDASTGVFFGIGGARNVWSATLPAVTTQNLEVNLNAGSGTLTLGGASLQQLSMAVNAGSVSADLTGATIGTIDATLNAGSGSFTLPNASLTGSIQVNAGSTSICVPSGVALQLRMDDNLTASNNYSDQGLTRVGNTWQSPGYATATTRINLDTHANAGSFTLNPKDGCR